MPNGPRKFHFAFEKSGLVSLQSETQGRETVARHSDCESDRRRVDYFGSIG
jgi:hypothetical protein